MVQDFFHQQYFTRKRRGSWETNSMHLTSRDNLMSLHPINQSTCSQPFTSFFLKNSERIIVSPSHLQNIPEQKSPFPPLPPFPPKKILQPSNFDAPPQPPHPKTSDSLHNNCCFYHSFIIKLKTTSNKVKSQHFPTSPAQNAETIHCFYP